jgi:hypothetical protein
LFRTEVSRMSKCEGRRVGGTSFWCHGDRRRKAESLNKYVN